MPTLKAPRTLRASKPTGTPSTVSFTAAVELDLTAAAEGQPPKRPTFSIHGYTGASMHVAGFHHPVIVDLAGLKSPSQRIPILLHHDPAQIVGATDAVTIDANGVMLSGTVTGDDGPASSVITHAKHGFPWQASIGASVARNEFLKAGDKTTVNGREVTGPMFIARESRLFETSFVPIGADPQTTASVAASIPSGTPTTGAHTMFEQWLQAKGIDPTALDDNLRKTLQAAYDAEQSADKAKGKDDKSSPKKVLEDIYASRRQEQERVEQITAMAASEMDRKPAFIDEIRKLADSAIEAKSSVPEFELNILRLRADAPTARSRSSIKETSKVIEAALCLAGGIEDPEKKYDERTLNAADERFPHGLGLRDAIMIAARDHGYSGHSSTDLRSILQAAFGGTVIRANDGFSTISLPGIFSNVANKFLVAGFNGVEDGWRDISAIRNVRDFKTVTSYSLTGGMMYDKVGPAGELTHATVGELAYTNKADTYGKMFAISRQDLINDDLGALTQVPMKLGRGAALRLNMVFWTAFLNNATTFWASGHGNVSSGAGSAFASAGLKAAQVLFRKQTDPDGNPLGVLPKILLVPPELEIAADELMTSLIVNTGGSSSATQQPNRNVWANKYKVVVSSYLSNANITNNSAAAWYLLCDPADLPTIEVAFLNGRDTPIVENADADFNTLGVQFRGFFDFGVAAQEWRASVRSIGS
jgi:hypothetical protein